MFVLVIMTGISAIVSGPSCDRVATQGHDSRLRRFFLGRFGDDDAPHNGLFLTRLDYDLAA